MYRLKLAVTIKQCKRQYGRPFSIPDPMREESFYGTQIVLNIFLGFSNPLGKYLKKNQPP